MIFRYGIVGVLLFLGMLSFEGMVCAQESYGNRRLFVWGMCSLF